jgi:hypothetical protein
VVWRLVWPFALALLAAKSVATMLELFPRSAPWNPSLLPAPNVAWLDAIVFVAAATPARDEPAARSPASSARA